eukprot:scaffold610894_cov13-Prasinocladus_malaysianus.AAC.1
MMRTSDYSTLPPPSCMAAADWSLNFLSSRRISMTADGWTTSPTSLPAPPSPTRSTSTSSKAPYWARASILGRGCLTPSVPLRLGAGH